MPVNLPQVRPRAPVWAKGLTDRERLFVEQYLVDWNRTQAVLRCGFTENANSARVLGSEMFHRPAVAEAIDKAISEKTAGPRVRLLARLDAIVHANIGDYFDWDDEVRGLVLKKGKDVPEELRSLIKGFEIRTKRVRGERGSEQVVKVQMHDSVRAAEVLAKLKPMRLVDGEESNRGGTALEEIIAASMRLGAEAAERTLQKRLEREREADEAENVPPVIDGECVEVSPDGSGRAKE